PGTNCTSPRWPNRADTPGIFSSATIFISAPSRGMATQIEIGVEGIPGAVKCRQGTDKTGGPGRQAGAAPGHSLALHRRQEVWGGLPGLGVGPRQVVGTHREGSSGGGGEQPLQGLGLDFNRFKSPLLLEGATVGGVPIAKVHQAATLLTGDAPVGGFVEGAGEVVFPVEQLVATAALASGQIQGFVGATQQPGPVAGVQGGGEQLLQVAGEHRRPYPQPRLSAG